MKNGFLAVLTVFLASDLGFAQSCDGAPVIEASSDGFWVSGDYLLWWFKNGQVPPLVTAGGDGRLGTPGTQVLLDNLDFDDDVRHGGRFALGYQLPAQPCLGVEGRGFFVAERESAATFASRGEPLLAQPFTNAVTGEPDANRVAMTGVSVGSVTIAAQTGLWGAEANLTADLVDTQFPLRAIAGFRFLQLQDELNSREQFRVAPDVPGFGGNSVDLRDHFQTVNNFYGGQVGLETGWRFGPLTLDFRGQLALGAMQQVADIQGLATVLRPDGSTFLLPGGLYALRSNRGRHHRDELAFIPEVGLNLGWQWTPNLTLRAGYSFLWISSVIRASEQIDPVINVSQFPIRSGDDVLVGPARPAVPFDDTDFWAQGLNIGLELRY